MVNKISTNPLQNIDSLLAEGVASSKCNLKNSKGLGCFPTSPMAKRTQGIYLCTACHFCDSITVSCFESSEKIDLGWMWGEFRSESRWLYLECTCKIVDFYNMHGYNIYQQRIVRFLATKIKLLQIVKYNWAG